VILELESRQVADHLVTSQAAELDAAGAARSLTPRVRNPTQNWDLPDAGPVGVRRRLHGEGAVDDGGVEGDLRRGPQLPVDQVGGFGDHEGRGRERVLGLLEQPCARGVAGVAAVGGCDDHPGVDEEHPLSPGRSRRRAGRPCAG
jgi:hypothetical protein